MKTKMASKFLTIIITLCQKKGEATSINQDYSGRILKIYFLSLLSKTKTK